MRTKSITIRMDTKLRNIFISILLLLPTLSFNAVGQSGENAFTILRTPYSSRAAANGGSNISIIDDDLTLAIHNPALLVNVSDMTANLTYMTYMSDSKIAGAMFNKAFGERSNCAAAIRYIDYGSFEGYTEDNIYTGSFSAKDIELSALYSYLLGEHWSGGVSANFIYSKYESMSSFSIGVDLGINYYNPENELSISIAAKNLGGQIKAFEERHHKMPMDFQAGITKRLAHAPIFISATLCNLHKWSSDDFYNADGSKDSFGELLMKHIIIGADILIGNNFNVSLGYNYRMSKELSTNGSKWDGLTAGAGLHIKKIKFGVSYSELHVSSSSLLFNLSYTL